MALVTTSMDNPPDHISDYSVTSRSREILIQLECFHGHYTHLTTPTLVYCGMSGAFISQ